MANAAASDTERRWVVRPATLPDVDAIGELKVRAWRHAYRGIVPDDVLAALDPAESASRFADGLSQPCNRIFVATQAGEPRLGAFCAVGPCREPERDAPPGTPTGEVYALYADPAVLGQGAGAAAHDAGVAHLRAVGYRHLVLWVFRDNPRAREFYARRGWRCDGAEMTYYADRPGRAASAVRYSRPAVTPECAASSPR